MATPFRTIFHDILATRSLTSIEYQTENALAALPKNSDPAERKTLTAILQANRLDEIYALCHDHLGQPERAKELRDWMAARDAQGPAHWKGDILDLDHAAV